MWWRGERIPPARGLAPARRVRVVDMFSVVETDAALEDLRESIVYLSYRTGGKQTGANLLDAWSASLAFSSKRLMHSRSLSIPLLGCWVIVGHVPAPILSCTRCVRQRGLPPSSARLPGVHGSGGWPCSVCGGAGHTSQYLDRGRQHRPGAPAFSRHGGSSHHPGGARAFGRGRPVVHARGQVRRFKLEAVSQYGQFVEPVYSR